MDVIGLEEILTGPEFATKEIPINGSGMLLIGFGNPYCYALGFIYKN